MKAILSALVGVGLLATASAPAFAADVDVPADEYAAMGWYLRGDAGWSWLHTDDGDDGALALGGGIGYQYSDNLRADIRADWAGLDGDGHLTTVLGNLYFDIPLDGALTPYLGAGAGYGWASGNDEGFAFALMAGVDFALTDRLSADLGYRYRQVLDGDDPHDHQVLLGLRYSF